jgi:hypothetical protein
MKDEMLKSISHRFAVAKNAKEPASNLGRAQWPALRNHLPSGGSESPQGRPPCRPVSGCTGTIFTKSATQNPECFPMQLACAA